MSEDLKNGRDENEELDADLESDLEPDQDSDSEFIDTDGNFDPNPPVNIRESIERLDDLLEATEDEDKIRAGMGIRLALGMAQELKSGVELGSETAELVSGWVIKYGKGPVEEAVGIARQFLIEPENLRKALGERLSMGKGMGTGTGNGMENGRENGLEPDDDEGLGLED